MRKDLAALMVALGLTLPGCVVPPDPRPGPIRAMEPRPNPPLIVADAAAGASVPARVRRNPWLARFWEELSPGQRRRVASGMRRSGAEAQGEAAERWDVMGLEERVGLVFGASAARPASASAATAEAGPDDGPSVAAAPESRPLPPATPGPVAPAPENRPAAAAAPSP